MEQNASSPRTGRVGRPYKRRPKMNIVQEGGKGSLRRRHCKGLNKRAGAKFGKKGILKIQNFSLKSAFYKGCLRNLAAPR